MKKAIKILFILFFNLNFGQNKSQSEKFKVLEPDVWLNIWDKVNSEKSIKIDTLSYDKIPKSIDFKGTVVEALKWNDTYGENILIQTVTGHFNWKEFDENSTDFVLQDKSELYAYLFRRQNLENDFVRVWRLYDFNKCYGVDWFTGFIPKATTITDIDKDGISEITMPYVIICRGGMDPGDMKIIMYEDNVKYALRGTTMLMCENKEHYGGEFEPSDNLKKNELLYNFLKNRWETHKCENGRFY